MQDAMAGARATHTRLMRTLEGLDPAHVAEPSRLPGWSRGHLLTHIARNADSHVRVLEAAVRGEVVEQYVGGKEGRATAIEAGARRSPADLIADIDTSARTLFELWDEVPGRVWDDGWVPLSGGKPAWIVPYSRWRETEIHHVDLDLGYEIEDWPIEFVAVALLEAPSSLENRLRGDSAPDVEAEDLDFELGSGAGSRVKAPARVVLAWLTGRLPEDDRRAAGLPSLSPWM